MGPIISVNHVNKVYESGHQALKNVNLEINRGEIFALLGPNGAGKTTLINIICGMINPTSGTVTVDGLDHIRDYRRVRSLIGLVPQEIPTSPFETVWHTTRFTRGLYGKAADDHHIETVLKDLSLWEKRHNKIMTLSGGMKRRLLIAKALSFAPRILFLDEPTAGVDVELRKDMWHLIDKLRQSGVTIILTTHYIDEAEQMADRIGIIQNGAITLVEEKSKLMQGLGVKCLIVTLDTKLDSVPNALNAFHPTLTSDGLTLIYSYQTRDNEPGIAVFLQALAAEQIKYKDLKTEQSSLEDIFVKLMKAA